jgi:MoaA/NifB/PqqE/SkfB family radical SAM enzyme
VKHVIWGLHYLAKYKILGILNPLICGLVLHNKCNLRCRHCRIVDRPDAFITYAEAVQVIDSFYSDGGRCLYLEGGEPFIWQDNSYHMEDIVIYAKKKGYHTVIIYTNGMKPLESIADTIFVSIDGLQMTHDLLRGRSFVRIMKNINNSNHPSIYVNYTINSENKDEIADFCKYIGKIPQIQGTFFYLHTPYYGNDHLCLDIKTKHEVLTGLIKLKSNYKILNSEAGLKSAIRNDWKKNMEICKVYESGRFYNCCRENNNGIVCQECGYLSYAEIDQTLKLKPGAILNAMKYF